MASRDSGKPRNTSVARASAVVSSVTLLSRVLGLVRDKAIAYVFGAGRETDAFFVAFRIPNLLRRLVAEGSLAPVFVPIFTDELEQSQERAAKAVAETITFVLILTICLTALGLFFSKELTELIAPGFSTDPEKLLLSQDLLSLMFPYLILVSLLALASSTLQSLGYFALPALAPAILNVAMIFGVIALSQFFQEPIFSLPWAVLLGGLLSLIPQFVLLHRLGYHVRLRSPFSSQVVRKLVVLMIPMVASASLYQLNVFFTTLLATMLIEQSVSWLYYADRLFQFPLGVFSIAVATAVLPSLSRHAARGETSALNRQMNDAFAWMTIITLPAAIGLIALSFTIIRCIFEGGQFDSNDSTQTALALCAFSVGLWPVSCQIITVRGFLAQKSAKIPAAITCVSLIASLVFAFALMGTPRTEVRAEISGTFASTIANLQAQFSLFSLAHVGLALAGTISSVLALLMLLVLLPRVNITLDYSRHCSLLLKSLLSCAPMLALIYGLLSLQLPDIITLLLCIPLAIAAYGGTSYLLNVPDVRNCARLLRDKFSK